MRKFLTAAVLTIIFFAGIFVAMQIAFRAPERERERETVAPVPPETFEETGYHYLRLSTIEQAAYAAIVLNIEMFPEEIAIPTVTAEQLGRAAQAVSLDHPMLYMFDQGVAIARRDEAVFFVPRYTCAIANYESAKEKVEQTVQSILAQMPPGTAYENELFLHDYLTAHCRYDEKGVCSDNFNPVGALLDGSAICSGYAKAYKLLLDAAGLENTPVVGKACEGGGEPVAHIWNAVKIDDRWYYVDPTWDDPIMENEELGETYGTHNYFNVTDAMLAHTHSDYTFDEPCDDESLFYYCVNNAYLTTEKQDVVQFTADLIAAAAESGRSYIDFKCENDDLFNAAINKLFKKEKIYRAVNLANLKRKHSFSNRSVQYSVDETNRRIIIVLNEKA